MSKTLTENNTMQVNDPKGEAGDDPIGVASVSWDHKTELMNQDTLQQIAQVDEKLMILHESWTDSKPEKKSTWADKIDAVLDERLYLMEVRTFILCHRLASEDPRIVEYCFSDKPDEIFTDLDLLREHRGLTEAQLKAAGTIQPLCK